MPKNIGLTARIIKIFCLFRINIFLQPGREGFLWDDKGGRTRQTGHSEADNLRQGFGHGRQDAAKRRRHSAMAETLSQNCGNHSATAETLSQKGDNPSATADAYFSTHNYSKGMHGCHFNDSHPLPCHGMQPF